MNAASSRLEVWLFAAAIGLGHLFGASTASSDLNFSAYTWHAQTMSSAHEPINILFTINGAILNAIDHIAHHSTFHENICSGNQYFYDHQTWEDTERTMATGGICDSTRDHVRLNQQRDDGGPNFGTFTMGAAHYEVGGCTFASHRVVSFNAARDDIWMDMGNGGHSSDSYYHANTDPYTECDGSVIQSDGWVRRVVIP